MNLDRDGSAVTRRFLIENALHWIHEYHADGLRLDATHALFDEGPAPFVLELTRAAHAAARSASDGVRARTIAISRRW